MLPVALMLLVIAISVAAIVSLVRFIFSSGNLTNNTNSEEISKVELLETTANKKVNMIVRGPIVSNENFITYKIEISPNSRVLTSYKGYTKEVINNVTLANSVPAYEQFVYALEKANFTKGSKINKSDDLRGVCASGFLYEFNILEDSEDEYVNSWRSTCSGAKGTMGASLDQIENLFQLQIPDSESVIKKLWQ